MNHSEQDFKRRLVQSLEHFKLYEIKTNQDAALKQIPVQLLHDRANEKHINCINKSKADADGWDGASTLFRDFLLMEVVAWFKEDFFKWIDTPKCPNCNGKTKLIKHGTPNEMEILYSAGRVELYTCPKCFPNEPTHEVARFPRYNDPVKLLTTRVGRCGEWANCFALICRAMGFEVRHVIDWTDHVWVEIFSNAQDRWIHCDPCENKVDSPLLYEVGWRKKLSYVIGVSQDDIQDVTWRYTTVKNFRNTLSRRTLVDEKWLVSTILELRKQYQASLSIERKQILQNRLVKELVKFINPEKDIIKDSEKQGRSTGSLAWRLSRNELGVGRSTDDNYNSPKYTWTLSDNYCVPNTDTSSSVAIYYDSVKDTYCINDKNNQAITGWQGGTFYSENIFRKRELDWEKVYLTRKESHGAIVDGKLSWKFELPSDSKRLIEGVDIYIPTEIFHSSVRTFVEIFPGDANAIRIPESCYQNNAWRYNGVINARSFRLTCTISGGEGDIAWQQGQFFRRSTETIDGQELCPFITIRMKNSH